MIIGYFNRILFGTGRAIRPLTQLDFKILWSYPPILPTHLMKVPFENRYMDVRPEANIITFEE